MGMPSKGPRLYLRKAADRKSTWIIRHNGRSFATGFSEEDLPKAQAVLDAYCAGGKYDIGAASRTALAPPPDRIYFVTCEAPDFPVKIGLTANVNDRISQLQVSLPYRITLLGTLPGNYERERLFHIRFAEQRLEGEWFARTPEIMETIRQLLSEQREDKKIETEFKEIFA